MFKVEVGSCLTVAGFEGPHEGAIIKPATYCGN